MPFINEFNVSSLTLGSRDVYILHLSSVCMPKPCIWHNQADQRREFEASSSFIIYPA